jgi:hypothetical protein
VKHTTHTSHSPHSPHKRHKSESFAGGRFSKANLLVFALLFAGIGGYALIRSSSAATLNATPSNFASVFSSAQGGDTILLASGNYGSFSGGAKASMVTIAAAPGATPMMAGGSFATTVRNITIRGVTFTDSVSIFPPSGTKMNLIFDGITIGDVGQGNTEGRLGLRGGGQNSIGGNGVQIKNSTFGPGGCSDGIQDISNGTEIGPNNEFKGILQSCGADQAHADALQLYGDNYAWVHDNYFHDNEQGIMSPDGPSTGHLIENNVIHTSTGYPCMHLGYQNHETIRHNVCVNGQIRVWGGNQGVLSTFMTVQDNGTTTWIPDGCPNCTVDHNQNVSYVGSPAGTRCAYATASPKGTASDGTDIGLNDCSGTNPPPAPPPPPPTGDTVPPTVSVSAPANNATVSGSSVTVSANASDNVGVVGVQFKLDGNNLGAEDTSSPYSITWNSTTVTNGTHTLTATARDANSNTTTATNITVTTNNATSCTPSSTAWANNSFAAKAATFSFDYDSTPQAAGIDAVTGLGSGAAAAYSDLAVIVRFNSTGTIDAVNGTGAGGNYTADATINYVAGTSYHFKVTINPVSHTYSVVVTPSGGSAVTLATNYPFRSEQATLSSFNNWTEYALSGSHTVCNATIGTGTTAKVGDINNDSKVDIFDMSILLSNYNGTTSSCDLNNDNVVNIFDLSILLSHYGT